MYRYCLYNSTSSLSTWEKADNVVRNNFATRSAIFEARAHAALPRVGVREAVGTRRARLVASRVIVRVDWARRTVARASVECGARRTHARVRRRRARDEIRSCPLSTGQTLPNFRVARGR